MPSETKSMNLPYKIACAAHGSVSAHARVRVSEASTVSVDDTWGDGSRTTVAFVNLETMARLSVPTQGSPFRPRLPDFELTPGVCAVEHSIFRGKDTGYRVLLHPDDYKRLVTDTRTCVLHEDCRANPDLGRACLASGASKLDERTGKILATFRSIKSGPYRREYLERLQVTEEDLARLVSAGWLSRSKAGAIKLTETGRELSEGVTA